MQDWAGHLIQLLLFCASKLIFNPDRSLDLNCCASTRSCAGGRSTLRQRQQHPSDCSSIILKILLSSVETRLENLWPLSAEAGHNTWNFAV